MSIQLQRQIRQNASEMRDAIGDLYKWQDEVSKKAKPDGRQQKKKVLYFHRGKRSSHSRVCRDQTGRLWRRHHRRRAAVEPEAQSRPQSAAQGQSASRRLLQGMGTGGRGRRTSRSRRHIEACNEQCYERSLRREQRSDEAEECGLQSDRRGQARAERLGRAQE